MKEYPYISIILLEFWFNMRQQLLENDLFVITNITERDGVYSVGFIKESWYNGEDVEIDIQWQRDKKIKELGI